MAPKNLRKEDMRSPWDLEEIRGILDLLAERGISEFEMEKNGFRVHVKRGAVSASNFQASDVVQAAAPAGQSREASAAIPSGTNPAVSGAGFGDLYPIKSPIVGTFYSAPKPGASPYVKVGDTVRKGQVLCIIEAMKLMNEIEADADGEVAKIFVENGQPVEYGQSLFGLAVLKPE